MNHALDLLTETATQVRAELARVDALAIAAAEHHATLAARRDELTAQYFDLQRAAAAVIAAGQDTTTLEFGLVVAA